MKRGDIVVAAFRGDYTGKPRPVVIIQSDALNPSHASVLVAPITTELLGTSLFRVFVSPSAETGLRSPSEIMVDKISAVPRGKVGQRIGELGPAALADLDRSIALVCGLS